MSNKTQLQTNNTNLDALISRVNAAKDTAASLPEAGGGGGGSNETITITVGGIPEPGMEIWYLDGAMNLHQETFSQGSSYTIIKGSLLVLTCATSTSFAGLTHIGGNNMCRVFLATG